MNLFLEAEECLCGKTCVANCVYQPVDIPLGVGRRLDTTPPGVPVRSLQCDESMKPDMKIDECIRTVQCVGNCGDSCTTPEKAASSDSVRNETEVLEEGIKEQALGLRYCPVIDFEMPSYNVIPLKAGTSRTIVYKFSFGKTSKFKEVAMVDKNSDTMEMVMETRSAVESMMGEGSRHEDPPSHGTVVGTVSLNLTLPEKGWEGGGGAVPLSAGGTLDLVRKEGEEGGKAICTEEEQFRDITGVKSLIMDWESKVEGEEGSGPVYNLIGREEEGRGGRRKSQQFMKLCNKFDEFALEKETEKDNWRIINVQQSEEPNPDESMSNFENVKDIYGNVKAMHSYPPIATFTLLSSTDKIPRGVKVWRQRKISFGNTGMSLVNTGANKKRGGDTDKGSAPKRHKGR